MLLDNRRPAKRAASFNPVITELRKQFGKNIADDPERLARVSIELSLLIESLDALDEVYDDGYPVEEFSATWATICKLQRWGVEFDSCFILSMQEIVRDIIGTDADSDADASDEALDLEDSDEDQDDPDEDAHDLYLDNELLPFDPGPWSPEFRRVYGLTNPAWWDEQCEVIRGLVQSKQIDGAPLVITPVERGSTT